MVNNLKINGYYCIKMYQNGKIYKLWSLEGDDIYIGSTKNSLARRLYEHKMNYKCWKQGKYHYVSSFQLFEKYDEIKIELIEDCPCNTKNELTRREGQIIRELDCVNKVIAGRTPQERCQDNKEMISQKKKEHYEGNKEHILQKAKEYYEDNQKIILQKVKDYQQENREIISERKKIKMICECGCEIRKSDSAKHFRTQKHLTRITRNPNATTRNTET